MANAEAADTAVPPETVEENEKKLKYLDFVQGAAVYVIACFSTIYEYAKENSGPLKPGVQTVEGTVVTVIGPVYEKFHDVPFQLLEFVDRKVDESVIELDRRVPALLKQASFRALTAAHKAPDVARGLASEVQRVGLLDTAANIANHLFTKYESTAKQIYSKYEPVAEQYAVSGWHSLNRLPLFPQVAQFILPTAAYWADKYNQAVSWTTEKGYPVSYYLPLVPIQQIAKMFEGAENEGVVSTGGEYVPMSQ